MYIEKKFPVVEVFGPTLQGEGALAGQRCSFVRFAYCDFSCPWCDTKYAHVPSAMTRPTMMTADDIASALCNLEPLAANPSYVTLTGGNPVMQPHVEQLFGASGGATNWNVETQGSLWKDWLNHNRVASVTVSPKLDIGPSVEHTLRWIERLRASRRRLHIKIVAFNVDDVDKVELYYHALKYKCAEFTVQSGTLPDDTDADILARYRRIATAVLDNQHMRHVRVLPQMHVLLWGHRKGV